MVNRVAADAERYSLATRVRVLSTVLSVVRPILPLKRTSLNAAAMSLLVRHVLVDKRNRHASLADR
jgi:hypothetical protein